MNDSITAVIVVSMIAYLIVNVILIVRFFFDNAIEYNLMYDLKYNGVRVKHLIFAFFFPTVVLIVSIILGIVKLFEFIKDKSDDFFNKPLFKLNSDNTKIIVICLFCAFTLINGFIFILLKILN